MSHKAALNGVARSEVPVHKLGDHIDLVLAFRTKDSEICQDKLRSCIQNTKQSLMYM